MLYDTVKVIARSIRNSTGKFKNEIYNLRLSKKKKVIIKKNCIISSNSILEGKNRFEKNCTIINCYIGFGTYFGPNCEFLNAKIGKFCSIAKDVKVIAGNHPTKRFVSTHPAFFSVNNQDLFNYVNKQLFNELTFVNKYKGVYIELGNDVWIGANVLIMSGVKIGDGAIVGAGSLVTKDLEPYGIYVGIPAKKISSRFNKDQIEILLQEQWWDKPEEWIKSNAYLFADIDKFVKELK